MKREENQFENPLDLRFVFQVLKKRIVPILLFTVLITGIIFFTKSKQEPVYKVEIKLIASVLTQEDMQPFLTAIPEIFNRKTSRRSTEVISMQEEFDLDISLLEVVSYQTSGEFFYIFRLNIFEEQKIDSVIRNFVRFLNHNTYTHRLKENYLVEFKKLHSLINDELEAIQFRTETLEYDPLAVIELRKELSKLEENMEKLNHDIFNPIISQNYYISYEENKPDLLIISLSAAFLSFMIALFAFMYIESIRQKSTN